MSYDPDTGILTSLKHRLRSIRLSRISERAGQFEAKGRAMILALIALGVAVLWFVAGGVISLFLSPTVSSQAVRWSIVLSGLFVFPPLTIYLVLRRMFSAEDRRYRETRMSRNIFKSFFSDADEVSFVCDTEGRFRTINPAGIRLFGLDPVWEDLSLPDVVDSEDGAAAHAFFPPPSAEDRKSTTLRIVTRQGKRVKTELHALTYRDDFGHPLGSLIRAIAVDEAPVAEEGAESVTDLQVRSLIEHYPDGVALLTLDGRVLLSNHRGEDYMADYGTFLAERRLVLFGGIPIDQLAEDGKNPRRQEVIVREPYHQVLEVHGRLLEAETNPRVLLVMRDVTSDQQRRDRLERSDRLAAVGQLAAGIAHDFKNILQGINLCAELSRSGKLSQAEHQDSMLTIIEQAHRGSKLIQQIMDFTRQSDSTQRLLDVGGLLRETTELLTPGIPENIEFRLDLPDDEHPVMADPGQLQQVIANLVLNAGHAMPDGGLLVVAVSRVGTEDDSGPVPPEIRMGDWIRISISDTGTGIPKSVQHRVFEPFFTTKSAHGGTGLGLAQVYGNIKQHGGHVEFETSDGIGTTFFIFLPMFTYHTGSKVESPEFESSPRGRGETILVVEDELAVLTATAQSLRSLGYSVLEATDGSDALHFVKEGKNVDLVLTDVRMPGEDGIRLAGRIRKLLPDVKILVMTGYASQLSKGNNAPEGVLGVLHKPFSMDYLAREVHRVLIS